MHVIIRRLRERWRKSRDGVAFFKSICGKIDQITVRFSYTNRLEIVEIAGFCAESVQFRSFLTIL